jgi:predicted nucleotide-binding protein (sugar kinase/HSP70/actin superfamily)
MYEAEYRLALRNSGFEGFRVVLFQQSGGLTQSDLEAGIAINADFFFGFLNALLVGDVLNQAGHAIRPYETVPGATDEWVNRSVDMLAEDHPGALPWSLPASVRRRLGGFAMAVEHLGKFSRQLRGDLFVERLRRAAGKLNSIDVDRLRVKPIVKITGEFWAQTTEGDGNFRMFRFLENEGAQVLVEPIATWVTYMVHQVVQRYHDTKGLEEGATVPGWTQPLRRARVEARHMAKMTRMKVAEAIFRREYHRLSEPFQGLVHHLTDQYELQRIAHPFYNSRAAGGEGHLEVAKNIHYLNCDLAHMVLSLKPFGCMPSTQSDAVQSAVAARFPDMIYLPIETSGEGEINAHSRVQMALGEARNKARAEFNKALSDTGQTLDECYAYVGSHPEMKRPLYHVPHHKGVAGLAANFVLHIAERRGLRA